MWEYIVLKLVKFVVMKREEIQSEKLKTYLLIITRNIFLDLRPNYTPIKLRPNFGHTQPIPDGYLSPLGGKLPDHKTDYSLPSDSVV